MESTRGRLVVTMKPTLLHVRGQQTSSVKGWRVNILGFVGHRVFVTITELCHCFVKTVTDYM